MKKKFYGLTTAALVAALVATGCSRGGHEETSGHETVEQTPVMVSLQTATKSSVEDIYTAVGTVRSRTTVMISAKIMGFAKNISAGEGDAVSSGDLLLELDAPEINAKVNQARAAVDEARSALNEIDNGIAGSESAVEAAKAGFELADATYARFEKLVGEDSVSRQEFDEVTAKWKMAKAELEARKKSLDATKSKKEQVKAKIRQAESAMAEATIMTGYTKVRAPITGVVLEKKVETGSLAAPGMPLMVIEDSQSYRLEATVDESRVSSIKTGDAVSVSIDALGVEQLTGTVDEINLAADATTRSFTVKISLPQNSRIRSGMYGRASFDMGQSEKMLIPAAAIIDRGGISGVFVVDENGTSRFRVVKTGEIRPDGNVEVFSGIAEGEKVVVSGVEAVTDGGKALVN